ncbi:MAG TPA: GNAT family N-acetyltransferase [Actinomycetota bacterium]|nr:GNAT family N-acetyltransferase [Actinomycetota bacterium]
MTAANHSWPMLEHPLQLEEIRTSLRDGTPVVVRPVRPDDRDIIRASFARLSPESRYFRFMTPVSTLSEAQLDYLTKLDFVDHVAWLAVQADQPEEGLGVARFVRTKADPTIAEAAVTVIDDYQGRGLGTLLLALLATVARAAGVMTFRAFVIQHNARMRNLLEQLGARTTLDSPGVLRMDVDLDPGHLPDSPPARVLRAAAQRVLGPVAGPSDLPDADGPRS